MKIGMTLMDANMNMLERKIDKLEKQKVAPNEKEKFHLN